MVDTENDKMIAFLQRHGAETIAHNMGSLLSHLIGTQKLLESWNVPQSVSYAGLFHSVYGTEVFSQATIPSSLRPEVRALIGDRAEQLAFLFGVMDRLSLFDNLFDPGPRVILSRFDESRIDIDENTFRDLCTLLVANWLEQRPRFPVASQNSKRREFDLMRPILPEMVKVALEAAYGFPCEGGK
jgi:hypothetical protein